MREYPRPGNFGVPSAMDLVFVCFELPRLHQGKLEPGQWVVHLTSTVVARIAWRRFKNVLGSGSVMFLGLGLGFVAPAEKLCAGASGE